MSYKTKLMNVWHDYLKVSLDYTSGIIYSPIYDEFMILVDNRYDLKTAAVQKGCVLVYQSNNPKLFGLLSGLIKVNCEKKEFFMNELGRLKKKFNTEGWYYDRQDKRFILTPREYKEMLKNEAFANWMCKDICDDDSVENFTTYEDYLDYYISQPDNDFVFNKPKCFA